MNYYIAKTVSGAFEDVIERVTAALKEEGFGVIAEIDVRDTLKEKLDVDFRPYRTLGACNPHFAHEALQTEPAVGTLLPCNVVVEESAPGVCEVKAINPEVAMQAIPNDKLATIASRVTERLNRVLANI